MEGARARARAFESTLLPVVKSFQINYLSRLKIVRQLSALNQILSSSCILDRKVDCQQQRYIENYVSTLELLLAL